MSGTGHSVKDFGRTGDQLIDGLLGLKVWDETEITYSFPTDSSVYGFMHEAFTFGAISDKQQETARKALDADAVSDAEAGFTVEGFTNLTISETTDANANIRIGTSNAPSTAYAYTPDNNDRAGDIWFGRRFDFSEPEVGTYSYITMFHEIGHTLGLNHGHTTSNLYGALPSDKDSMEYSIMTYRSYVGQNPNGGYDNETYGYAQSFMMADIAALQAIYGADFTTNSDDTVYKWDPNSGKTFVNGEVGIDAFANRIFATIWDGGGIDTYDLSSYSNDLRLDLRAGEHSTFSQTQSAQLGAGNVARGNIFNALQYQGDERSLIENAIGGSGDDTITGNQAANHLMGGRGRDTLSGLDGDDRLEGGAGDDVLEGGSGSDIFFYNMSAEVIQPYLGFDRISDFDVNLDKIESIGGYSTSMLLNDVEFPGLIEDSAAGVEITLSENGTRVLLEGVSASQLSERNFDTGVDETVEEETPAEPDTSEPPEEDNTEETEPDTSFIEDTENVTLDILAETQYISGTSGYDVFVIDGDVDQYVWNDTADGSGTVIYRKGAGFEHDIVYHSSGRFEELRFNDRAIDLAKYPSFIHYEDSKTVTPSPDGEDEHDHDHADTGVNIEDLPLDEAIDLLLDSPFATGVAGDLLEAYRDNPDSSVLKLFFDSAVASYVTPSEGHGPENIPEQILPGGNNQEDSHNHHHHADEDCGNCGQCENCLDSDHEHSHDHTHSHSHGTEDCGDCGQCENCLEGELAEGHFIGDGHDHSHHAHAAEDCGNCGSCENCLEQDLPEGHFIGDGHNHQSSFNTILNEDAPLEEISATPSSEMRFTEMTDISQGLSSDEAEFDPADSILEMRFSPDPSEFQGNFSEDFFA